MTAARWAAILDRTEEGWKVASGAGLVKSQLKYLAEYLATPDTGAWVNGASSIGRNRWKQVPPGMSILSCAQIHLFPVQGGQAAILVGSDAMEKESAALWRLISLGVASIADEKAMRKQAEHAAEIPARQLTLVKQLSMTISVFADPVVRARAAAMEIAHAFGASCVEIMFQNRMGWSSVIYDSNHGEDTRPLETRITPGKDFLPRFEPRLIVLELCRGAKTTGYLKIQAASAKLDTQEYRDLAELYGTLLSGIFINSLQA